MPVPKLHEGEVDIDEGLVRRLLSEQFPEWADLPLEWFPSSGTVNVIYRLGDDMYVRLPRVENWAWHQKVEAKWLPRMRPHIPFELPERLGAGVPSADYPFEWAVHRWLQGDTWTAERLSDETEAARDLARFLRALHAVDTSDAKRTDLELALSLAAQDDWVRSSIDRSREWIDADALTAAWDEALTLPPFDGPWLWVHSDIGPDNLLLRRGRLSAVLDWGSLHVGDAAHDVAAAWSLFSAVGRAAFREVLGVDDATWARARGWAMRSVGGIFYYIESNPPFAAAAIATIEAVLEE